jgi:phosphate starvation-inducible protein PhoH and related proteins
MGKPRKVNTNHPDPILPQTPNQDKLIKAINGYEQVVVLGPAGTGKSFITAGMAADWYAKNSRNRIIITRPMVPVGEDFGYLPGTLEEKTMPWAMPVLDIIQQRVGAGKLECDLGKTILIEPLQLMRGRTFDDAWIIADECQNLTVEQAKMLVTRVGVNAKLLINGDLKQKDIDESSGLQWIINNIHKHNLPIPVVEFDIDDCQRSGICKMWLEVMDKETEIKHQPGVISWETVAKR